MSTRSRLLAATGGMTVITAISRVSGYAREKAIAALIGATPVADAFYAGLAIPNMFRAFLAEGALHAAFIPALSEMSGDRERARSFVRAMTATLLLALPVLIAVGVLAAPSLVELFAPGVVPKPEQYELAVRLTRLMFPYLGFITLAALAQGVLNASGRFLLPAATPIALNVLEVGGAIVAASLLGGAWEWLAYGVLIGGLAQFAMQWPATLRAGLPMVPGRRALGHPDVRRVLWIMLPGIPALGVYQLTLLASIRFASSVGAGGITTRFNAARLSELVYGVVIVQLTTAILPMLAAERARDEPAARGMVGFGMRLLSLVALPTAVVLGLLAVPIAGTLYGGGEYTPEHVLMTAGALAMYAWGLPFLALTRLLAATSYAWKDLRVPLVAAVVNLLVFYALGLVWTPLYGVAGIAAAASAGQAGNAFVLLLLNGRAGRLPGAGEVVPSVLRHGLAAAMLAAALLLVRPLLPPMLATGVRSLGLLSALGLGAVGLYLVALVALGAHEWRELREVMAARRRR